MVGIRDLGFGIRVVGIRAVGIRVVGICAGISLLTGACSTAAQQSKVPNPTDVVATVGTTRITLAQVDEVALQQPAGNFGGAKLSQALYQARRATLEQMVGDALIAQEAAARGITREALVQQEVSSKVVQPTDADIDAWYQTNQ